MSARPISFRAHEVRVGSIDGARADFQQMIAQLVRASTPSVRTVAANPGDWGIDVFVGSLADEIVVWQSKYFIAGVGDAQQRQIRESFASLVSKAIEKGFTVRRWVLCIPVSMDGPATRWWDRWRKRQEKEHGVQMELWDETELISLLISPDTAYVREHYYGVDRISPLTEDLRPIRRLKDPQQYDNALFIRQMCEAGHTELRSCKEQFFNAEIIAREIHDKGILEEEQSFVTADANAHAIWEARFSEACERNANRLLPGLHQCVMADVRAERPALPRVLRLGPVHAMGLVHRTVEDGRAGWVRDFRRIATQHLAGTDDQVPVTVSAPAQEPGT